MTSNHILALKVVLADGTVTSFGSDSHSGIVDGPDLIGMFVGSEGLFGIALEITVKLLPIPERFRTVLAAYSSLEAAGDAVSAVVSSGLLPGAMEIMDALAIKAAETSVNAGYPQNAAALLIVELDGEQQQVEAEFELLKRIISESGAEEIRTAETDEERMLIWKGRKSAFSAVGRISPDYLVQDGVVHRRYLGKALAEIEQLSKQYNLPVANVFHAGDGNLHPLILYDGRIAGALEKAEELAGEILKVCIKMGGSITGEHGVGMEKRSYMPDMFSEDDMNAMQRIRQALDPASISNPGKMFPGAEASALSMSGPHPLEKEGIISRE